MASCNFRLSSVTYSLYRKYCYDLNRISTDSVSEAHLSNIDEIIPLSFEQVVWEFLDFEDEVGYGLC